MFNNNDLSNFNDMQTLASNNNHSYNNVIKLPIIPIKKRTLIYTFISLFAVIGLVLIFTGFITNKIFVATGLCLMSISFSIYVGFYYKLIPNRQLILVFFLIFTFIAILVIVLMNLQSKPKINDYVVIYNQNNENSDKENNLAFYNLNTIETDMNGENFGRVPVEYLRNELPEEFTYSFWLKVCPDNFKKFNKYWKNVFYKGESSGINQNYKNKTPGVYLSPNINKLIITVACANGPDEGNAITIEDIPLNTYFCVTFVLQTRSLDCYINGLLERSITLTGQIKENNNDLFKGSYNGVEGFDGKLCFFRYNDSALTPANIMKKYKVEKSFIDQYLKNNTEIDDCKI